MYIVHLDDSNHNKYSKSPKSTNRVVEIGRRTDNCLYGRGQLNDKFCSKGTHIAKKSQSRQKHFFSHQPKIFFTSQINHATMFFTSRV